MTDSDLDRLLQEDRASPLTETPDVRMTISAVRRRTGLEKNVSPVTDRPPWALVGSAAALCLCTPLVLVASGMSPVVFAVPGLLLVASQALVQREVERT